MFIIAAVLLTIILIFKIITDLQSWRIVENNWPKGLSKKIKVEIWEICKNDDELGKCCYRDKTIYLENFVYFFIAGHRVPSDCSEDNPVVIVDDLNKPFGTEIIIAKTAFEANYTEYKQFDSYREYIKYIAKSV